MACKRMSALEEAFNIEYFFQSYKYFVNVECTYNQKNIIKPKNI